MAPLPAECPEALSVVPLGSTPADPPPTMSSSWSASSRTVLIRPSVVVTQRLYPRFQPNASQLCAINMAMRPLIDLLEHAHRHVHGWHGASRQAAQHLLRHGVHLGETKHGRAFVVAASPDAVKSPISLEYRLGTHGIGRDHPGQNGLYASANEVFYVTNPDNLHFLRVYDGVVHDPLEETDTKELDEYALGGLARCTAVTVNAILTHFHRPPIRINEVPINQPGVLRVFVG